jgi:hypothetical protein
VIALAASRGFPSGCFIRFPLGHRGCCGVQITVSGCLGVSKSGSTYIGSHVHRTLQQCTSITGATYPQILWGPQQTWPLSVQMCVATKIVDHLLLQMFRFLGATYMCTGCGYAGARWSPNKKFAGTWRLPQGKPPCTWCLDRWNRTTLKFVQATRNRGTNEPLVDG